MERRPGWGEHVSWINFWVSLATHDPITRSVVKRTSTLERDKRTTVCYLYLLQQRGTKTTRFKSSEFCLNTTNALGFGALKTIEKGSAYTSLSEGIFIIACAFYCWELGNVSITSPTTNRLHHLSTISSRDPSDWDQKNAVADTVTELHCITAKGWLHQPSISGYPSEWLGGHQGWTLPRSADSSSWLLYFGWISMLLG